MKVTDRAQASITLKKIKLVRWNG